MLRFSESLGPIARGGPTLHPENPKISHSCHSRHPLSFRCIWKIQKSLIPVIPYQYSLRYGGILWKVSPHRPPYDAMPAVADLLPTQNLAHAEAKAIQTLAEFLTTEEGRAAGDQDIQLWMVDHGWPPRLWRKWSERIAAALSLQDPTSGDPRFILAKLNERFERLAHRAEEFNDLKHAIQASEAQAKLNKAGGFAPPQQQGITVNFTNATAHLASDEDLARIAKQAEVLSVSDGDVDDLLA